MLAVAFGAEAAAVIDDPPLLVMPVALVLAIGILSTALMRSDVEHRTEAVIDPLTAMLNRKALREPRRRAAPAVGRVRRSDRRRDGRRRPLQGASTTPIGHAGGDAVLRDVAYLIRKDLRAFELAYRIGGEEFLVLLPGADRRPGLALAERLREAVGSSRFAGGLSVTVSLRRRRVAARRAARLRSCARGRPTRPLYEAKRGGRNRAMGDAPEELAAA